MGIGYAGLMHNVVVSPLRFIETLECMYGMLFEEKKKKKKAGVFINSL